MAIFSPSSIYAIVMVRDKVLLYPFWNHWWSLQSDWLSAVWFIHESHYFLLLVTSVLNCAIIHVLTHVISVLNRAIFALYCIISVSGTKWDVKAFSFPLFNKPATWKYNIATDWILCFQNGCDKVVTELHVVQFWTEIILVISNWTRAGRLSDFQITRMISDQTALHSVQLPLFMGNKS